MVRLRQQLTLDARRELEIVLERPLFLGRQVIDAEPRQGIGRQPLRLDRIVARFADAERAPVHAGQRHVDFTQQSRHLVTPAGRGGDVLQLVTPIEQLFTGGQELGGLHVNSSIGAV